MVINHPNHVLIVLFFIQLIVISFPLDLVVRKVEDLRNVDEIVQCMKACVASKQYGNEDFLTELVAKACGTSAKIIVLSDPCFFNIFL